MTTTFIYALNDPETGECRYVGKADTPAIRLLEHLQEIRKAGPNHRLHWIRLLMARGLKPILEILQEVPKTEWQLWERAWIKASRKIGMDLTNATDGGEGLSNPSPSTREKMSAAKIGRSPSEETRKKMSRTRQNKKQKNSKSGFVGVSPDTKSSKWTARIFVNSKQLFLGNYSKIEDAVFIHALAVDKYFSKIA